METKMKYEAVLLLIAGALGLIGFVMAVADIGFDGALAGSGRTLLIAGVLGTFWGFIEMKVDLTANRSLSLTRLLIFLFGVLMIIVAAAAVITDNDVGVATLLFVVMGILFIIASLLIWTRKIPEGT